MRMKLTKYLDKLNNPAKPVRVAKAPALMNHLESLQTELANLAWQDWSDGEKQDLTNRLQDLKQGVDALLQAMEPVLQ